MPSPTVHRSAPRSSTPSAHDCLANTATTVSMAAKVSTPGLEKTRRSTCISMNEEDGHQERHRAFESNSLTLRRAASLSIRIW